MSRVYIYVYMYVVPYVRLTVNHLRLLFCAFLRHALIQKLFTKYSRTIVYLLDGNSKDGDHSWTYLFND